MAFYFSITSQDGILLEGGIQIEGGIIIEEIRYLKTYLNFEKVFERVPPFRANKAKMKTISR